MCELTYNGGETPSGRLLFLFSYFIKTERISLFCFFSSKNKMKQNEILDFIFVSSRNFSFKANLRWRNYKIKREERDFLISGPMAIRTCGGKRRIDRRGRPMVILFFTELYMARVVAVTRAEPWPTVVSAKETMKSPPPHTIVILTSSHVAVTNYFFFYSWPCLYTSETDFIFFDQL